MCVINVNQAHHEIHDIPWFRGHDFGQDLHQSPTVRSRDKDGRVGLQDVAPLGAVALASFRRDWAMVDGFEHG